MRHRHLFRATLLVGCLGCAAERDPRDLLVPQEIGVPVVDAMLLVDQAFPQIYLTRTIAANDVFDAASAIIPGAGVTIEDVESGVVTSYFFAESSGKYAPRPSPEEPARVLPDRTYRLRIETPDGESIRAETRTPPHFRVQDWVVLDDRGETVLRTLRRFDEVAEPDSLYSEPNNQLQYSTGLLEARLIRPAVPAFQVGLHSLDLGSDFVIDPDFFDAEDFGDLERIGSSPPLLVENGKLRLPWFAIYFAGRYVIKVFAMDDNWYDLARSVPELSQGGPGFGGNIGDNFERPIFHLDGAIGLFGSATVDSIGFFIQPNP